MAKRLIGSSDSTHFGLDVARGIFPSTQWVNKFGLNPSMDSGDPATDIWEFGESQPEYIFPTWGTAPIDRISSDNAADTMDLCIQGLGIDGRFVDQTITLTGLTPVTMTTPLWRVFRMFNVDENLATGQGTDITGVVYCFENSAVTLGVPDDDTKVRAIITDGNNQTLMGIYTVPKGMTGYFMEGGAGITKEAVGGSAAVLQLRMRDFGGVLRIQKSVAVNSNGASYFIEKRSVFDPIPELSDVVLTCAEVSANGTAVWGSIEILLVDENVELGLPSEA